MKYTNNGSFFMQVVYANQTPPESWSSAIFLAGPTPRANTTLPSWRPEALTYLEESGFSGVVFVPEDEDGTWRHSYDDQVEWEEMCLNFADVIIFWIPRELQQMPAFTTNDEWGFWKAQDPMKLVLGTPKDAPKVRYQRYYANKHDIPLQDTLRETCAAALEKLGETGCFVRGGGERSVPLHVWRTSSFQEWYGNLVAAGNRLEGAKVEWVFRVGPSQQIVFFWVLYVDIYVAAEDRHKTNEVVIGRPDISAIVLYEKREPVCDSRVVIVKEFRSPVFNDKGYIFELPGGASLKAEQVPLDGAVEECFEEVGLRLTPERFAMHQARQVAATTLTHRAHLFSAELSSNEMDRITENAHVVRGIEEESERVWSGVMTYGELLDDVNVDWSVLGMVSLVLREQVCRSVSRS